MKLKLSVPTHVPYFFDQTLRLLFISLHVSVWLLFEGSVYFFGKPADINTGTIRYLRAIRWQLLDAVSSKCSLYVLLSGVETSHTTRTALTLDWWLSSEIVCVRVLRIVAAATIRGWHLFRSELLIVRLLFEGSDFWRNGIPNFRTSKRWEPDLITVLVVVLDQYTISWCRSFLLLHSNSCVSFRLLYSNRITSLPAGVFSQQSELTLLWVYIVSYSYLYFTDSMHTNFITTQCQGCS